MVAVPAEHVTLTVDRESALHVPRQLRSEEFRGNREPLALASHVGTASLRLHNDLRLQEIERVLECLRCTVGVEFRKTVHASPATAGLIHGGEVVAFAHAYYAVAQGMDPPRLGAALFIRFGNLPPPFPGTGDDDCNFLLQVFGRDRLLVPLASLAVCPGGNDRMEGNHTKACWCSLECFENIGLVPTDRPGKTSPIDEQALVFQPNRQGSRLSCSGAPPPPPGGVLLRDLRVEHVPIGLYVGPATFASFFDKVFDHLLMFHRFGLSHPCHSPLQKAALTVQQPPFFGILSWHVPDVPSGRSQA